MVSLFVDTSFYLVVGILNEKWEWLEYEEIIDTKSSAIIHRLIFDLLNKNDLTVANIKNIIHVAGPGSYTGVRLSEGLSQIFALNKINTYSFYHFDIPKYLNIAKGSWIVKAHKGELFVHSWDGENFEDNLIQENEFEKYLELGEIYTHYKLSFDLVKNPLNETGLLIRDNSKKIFSTVVESNLKQKPFYFRSIDQEFNRGKASL